jgi:hypothetical protein
MGWTDRVLHSSSNNGAANTERDIITTKQTSQAMISTIGIDIGFGYAEGPTVVWDTSKPTGNNP